MQLVICCDLCSGVLMDVKRDNRVLSLVNHAGLKGTLSQMLDQLQRCQKSLNEFLEVFSQSVCSYLLQLRSVHILFIYYESRLTIMKVF